jgi:hypothetical protein
MRSFIRLQIGWIRKVFLWRVGRNCVFINEVSKRLVGIRKMQLL